MEEKRLEHFNEFCRNCIRHLACNSDSDSLCRKLLANSDLPLPHGLAPSDTMVSDHGLNPALNTVNPMHEGLSVSGAPLFGFGLADPAPKG